MIRSREDVARIYANEMSRNCLSRCDRAVHMCNAFYLRFVSTILSRETLRANIKSYLLTIRRTRVSSKL